jgi:hypothetical protein
LFSNVIEAGRRIKPRTTLRQNRNCGNAYNHSATARVQLNITSPPLPIPVSLRIITYWPRKKSVAKEEISEESSCTRSTSPVVREEGHFEDEDDEEDDDEQNMGISTC